VSRWWWWTRSWHRRGSRATTCVTYDDMQSMRDAVCRAQPSPAPSQHVINLPSLIDAWVVKPLFNDSTTTIDRADKGDGCGCNGNDTPVVNVSVERDEEVGTWCKQNKVIGLWGCMQPVIISQKRMPRLLHRVGTCACAAAAVPHNWSKRRR
jgi:hypothetical protein